MERLYVAQGSKGLLKIGRSNDPMTRKIALDREFARRGQTITRFEFCDEVEYAAGIEWALQLGVAKTCERETGREWFLNGDFDKTFAFAQEKTAERIAIEKYDASPAGKRAAKRREAAIKRWQEECKVRDALAESERQTLLLARQQKSEARKRRKFGPMAMVVNFLVGA